MIIRTFAALALCAVATPALAEDWRLVSTSADNSAAMLIDRDSISRDPGGIYAVDILIVIKPGAQPMDAVVSETRLDCGAAKIRVGKSTSFDADGKSLQVEEDRPEFGWDPIIKGSNYEAVADVICGRVKMPANSYGASLPIAPVREVLAKL